MVLRCAIMLPAFPHLTSYYIPCASILYDSEIQLQNMPGLYLRLALHWLSHWGPGTPRTTMHWELPTPPRTPGPHGIIQ